MGKTIIGEELFPEIIEQYNAGGKSSAYDHLRSRYGIKNPFFVLRRIKACGKYDYDPSTDHFSETGKDLVDNIFMDLDELCSTSVIRPQKVENPVTDTRPAAMEKLVHELISDRLLTLSRYITLDSSTRKILIDQTSLMADGYQIVTH